MIKKGLSPKDKTMLFKQNILMYLKINVLIHLILGISMLALASVQGYHGYLLFSWMYGMFLGGFEFSLKIYTLEMVRVRQFPRGWGFVQGAKAIPAFLGIPIAGYINDATSNPKAGLYFSVAACLGSAIILFFVDSLRSSMGNVQLGPYMYENRGELCKTDTNLTFELLGGAGSVGGNVPESASIDSAGALQVMMMKNGGPRFEKQLSFFQAANSTNSSVRRKYSDNLIMKSVSQCNNDTPDGIEPCNNVDGSLQCTCPQSNETNSTARKISILSNHSDILVDKSLSRNSIDMLLDKTLPTRKKSSSGSRSLNISNGQFTPAELVNESSSIQAGGTYVEKNGIYEELTENDAMASACEDINSVIHCESTNVKEVQTTFQDNHERKSSNTGSYVKEIEDDVAQFPAVHRISFSGEQFNGVDDEVEEGGDILIDEELLVEAAEEEPELLSCAMIDIPIDVFEDENQHTSNGEIPLQHKKSLSYVENGGINGDFLGMINEEDEELVSPEEPEVMFGLQHSLQYSQILNRQMSESRLVNKNLSLSEPEINLIGQDNETENIFTISPLQDTLPFNGEKICISTRKFSIAEHPKRKRGILAVELDDGRSDSTVNETKGQKISRDGNKSCISSSSAKTSCISNVVNTNAFNAVTTRAEVTSYV